MNMFDGCLKHMQQQQQQQPAAAPLLRTTCTHVGS
jgi:hypothetical protein